MRYYLFTLGSIFMAVSSGYYGGTLLGVIDSDLAGLTAAVVAVFTGHPENGAGFVVFGLIYLTVFTAFLGYCALILWDLAKQHEPKDVAA